MMNRRTFSAALVAGAAASLLPTRSMAATFPTVPLRLLVKALNGVERLVRKGDAGIGVGSLMHMDNTGMR